MVSGWTVVGATAIGPQHARLGRPNQDAYGSVELAAGTLAFAVADGHGGARYVRSDRGARLAVEVGLDVAQDLSAASSPAVIASQVPGRIVRNWADLVEADLRSEPLSVDELALLRLREGESESIAYGATLIVVAAGPDAVTAFQIGDGDVLVATPAALCHRLVPGDRRLVANTTTSLCSPSAALDFRTGTMRVDQPTWVVIATDGYGNSFADDTWPSAVMGDFARLTNTVGMQGIAENLSGWLAESAAACGDDVTVLVAHFDVTESDDSGQ